MGNAWKLAPAIQKLLEQVNAKYPARGKSSDGTIGDANHSARASDHNPDDEGFVCALDITHDPRNGVDSEKVAEGLRLARDPRTKYIISNKKIANSEMVEKGGRRYEAWEWSPYPVPPNKNPHNHHCHVSVTQKGKRDSKMWDLSKILAPTGDPTQTPLPPPLLKVGSRGNSVFELQQILKITADGFFGGNTKAAVQSFQRAHELVDDGIVGPATWALLKGTK